MLSQSSGSLQGQEAGLSSIPPSVPTSNVNKVPGPGSIQKGTLDLDKSGEALTLECSLCGASALATWWFVVV